MRLRIAGRCDLNPKYKNSPKALNSLSTAYVALGSNRGDRDGFIALAVDALAALDGVRLITQSPLYETDPVGGVPQDRYLNGVVALECTISPAELLAALLRIEQTLGRTRTAIRNEPRTIDLDLLLWGDTVIDEPTLKVPHPRMHERWFVLKPLFDIAPDVRHPVLELTARQLLEKVEKAHAE